MDVTGRIESDGTHEGTRVWLGEVEVTSAVYRIEWVADARGKRNKANVAVFFTADVALNITGLSERDPAPLFTETVQGATNA